MDFVLFNAGLRDYSYSSQRIENPSKEDVLRVLGDARNICLNKMPAYSPINFEAIKKLAPATNTFEDAAKHFESTKSSHLESLLRPFVTMPARTEEQLAKAKGDPIDFAFSAYVFFVLQKLLPTTLPKPCASPKEVKFASNYSGWVAIKKCDLTKCQDKEVLATLVGIHYTLARKIPELASSDYSGLCALADRSLASYPERRSYARLPALLREAEKLSANAKKFFPTGFELEATYFAVTKTLERCGFSPYVVPEVINENFPELKIPKPKGNFGKKKK